MRLGVIDVGSNTVHLLVVDAHSGGAQPLPTSSHKIALRLSEYVEDDGRIADAGRERLAEFVDECLHVGEDQGVEELMGFATSAIREAPNGDDVLAFVKDRTGVTLDVLSGPDEAKLTFLAIRRWFGWSAGTLLMVDMSWFREQVCVVVCPYGRLQSALIDADTIQIGYDKQRGEPRGKAGTTTGDCVDCFRCVAVCPTGIDIRNGTQLECVGCTNCIDACDSVMKKLGRPEGLVRYDSLRGFEGKRRGLLRPRAFVYAFLGLLGLSVATFAASHRSTFEANLMRAKGLPYELGETSIRNLITMHLQNKTGEARTYFVAPALSEEAEELDPEFIIPEKRVHIPAMGDVKIPLFVTVSREKYEEAFELSFAVTDSATGKVKPVKAKFLGP